jgi:hypothetical protein
MTKPQLDDLIEQLARQKVPDLPGAFANDVLREIRLRRDSATKKESWLADLLNNFLRPPVYVAAVTAALVVGLAAPLALARSDTDQTIAGLDLNVFSSVAPNVPSGLLNRIP